MGKNRVKYDLKNVHYALFSEAEDGTITYQKPEPFPGSVSLSLEAKGESSPFYADGITYYLATANNGYEGDYEAALIPEKFRVDVLGEELDEKKVLIEDANAKQNPFALLFEFAGDEKAIRHVLYNCSATRPSVESKTKEETIEPVTETLSIAATPRKDGKIKAKTSDSTDESVYASWYESVYEPTSVSGGI